MVFLAVIILWIKSIVSLITVFLVEKFCKLSRTDFESLKMTYLLLMAGETRMNLRARLIPSASAVNILEKLRILDEEVPRLEYTP